MGEMCRLCLSEKDVLIPIFYRGSDLPDHIKACLAVQVSMEDFHKHICITCDGKLRYWWNFKLEIQSAQKFLNNQYSKTLFSRTVTSSAENQNLSDGMSRSNVPLPNQSIIRVQNCHSLAFNQGMDSQNNPGFNNPITIKQEKGSPQKGSMQMMPVPSGTSSYYQNSHLDVSSSSGGNAYRHDPSTSNNARSLQDDDCMVIDPPPKRKCPTVTLENSNKRAKLSSEPGKKSKSKMNPSQPRLKPGAKPQGLIPQQGGRVPSDKSGPWKCHYCPSVFPTKANLAEHLQLHSDNRRVGTTKIPCPYCSVSLQVYSLSGHVRNIHKMDPEAAGILTYIETKVGKVPTNLVAQRVPTSGVKLNGMKMVVFPCTLCKNSYKTLFALKMHKKRHHVGQVGSNLIKKKTVLTQSASSSQCDRCSRQLKNIKQLTHHKSYCGTEGAFICPYDSKQFEVLGALRKHMTHSHSNEPEPVTTSELAIENQPTLNPLTGLMEEPPAPEVDPVMNLGVNLNQPEVKSKAASIRRCPVCTRKFLSKEKLLEHRKYCGTVKAFKCPLCPEQYISIRSANSHSKVKHNKIVLPCDFCNQKFSSRQELDDHHKQHKNSMKTKLYHKCRSCQNVFHGLQSFTNHKVQCRESFLYKCEKCFLRFQSENALTSHSPQCTGKSRLQEKLKLALKTIKCLQCTNKFAGENEFINHFVESHVNAANSIFSGVNSFDCHYCFYAANNPNSCKKHISHCRGISFYVVKSSTQKHQPLAEAGVSNKLELSSHLNSTAENISESLASSSGYKQSDVEITQICSTAFMNEHLNASKNAQVVVEKLSDSMLSSAFVSVKMEPVPRPPMPSPREKVRCEFCKKFFTPQGYPSHRCPRKKKIMAKNAREQTKQKIAESNPLIKCELCYGMIAQDSLQEHLRAVHQAVKPAEMARSMIELSMMKHSLNVHDIKLEKSEEAEGASDEEVDAPENEDDEAVEADIEAEEFENEAAEADIEMEEVDEAAEGDIEAEEVDDEIAADIEGEEFLNVELNGDIETGEAENEVLDAENESQDAKTNGDITETILPEVDADKEQNTSTNESQEDAIRCDICQSVFSLPDLEIHLKDVHHAVNPAAMARIMMENNLELSKLSIKYNADPGSESEEEEACSPADSEEKAEDGHGEESQSPEPPSLETRILESIESAAEEKNPSGSTNLETG